MNVCDKTEDTFNNTQDYNEYEYIVPYNKIVNKNQKWSSLYLDAHPNTYLIQERFSTSYSGKLFWFELKKMKKKIDDKKNELLSYQNKVKDDMKELSILIFKQKQLCRNDSTCVENLKKHIHKCQSNYKCTEKFLSNDCMFNDSNGRCSHYFKLQHLVENLEHYECNINEDIIIIDDLEYYYNRALAIKENRSHYTSDDDSY